MVFTERELINSFEEILETTPFDRIRVRQVVDRCGVSTHTFYYHFRDIYDLLEKWALDRSQQIDRAVGEDADWKVKLSAVLHTMKEHPRVVTHILQPLPRERIERFFFVSARESMVREVRKNVEVAAVSEEDLRWTADFLSNFILGYLLRFVWDGFSADIDGDVEKIGILFDGILKTGIRQIGG